MDWLSGNFCEEFASSSSITDIVDLVGDTGNFDSSEHVSSQSLSAPQQQGSAFGSGLLSMSENNNQISAEQALTVTPAPAPTEDPAQAIADTTGDPNYYYDGKKREQKRRPKPKDGSQLLCVICGDRALGYNFDAITCESCKAFFRRNALKTKVFTCSFEGNCKLDPHTRKFCSGCRLKKCLEAGMKKEWILSDDQLAKRRKRGSSGSAGDQPIQKQYNLQSKTNGEMDRKYTPMSGSGGSFSDSQGSPMDTSLAYIPTSVKQESFSPPQVTCGEVTTNYLSDDTDTSSVFASTSPSVTSPPLTSPPLTSPPLASPPLASPPTLASPPLASPPTAVSPPDIKLEQQDAEDFSLPLSEEVTNNIANLEREYMAVFDSGYSEEQAKKFTEKPHNANELFNMTDIFIRRLIKFAKHIPEFRALKQEDQIHLLKGGIMEIMVLRSAMGFDMSQHQWKIQENIQNQAQEHKLDPRIIKEQLGQSMYREHVKFVTSLHQLTRSDRTIMTLLFVIELFSPDRANIGNKEGIAGAQEKFSYWLQCYLQSIMSVNEAKVLYPKLLVKLLDVRNLGESSAKLASHLDIQKLEPLLIEVFNLQK